jgi:hypothetical protein
MNAIASSQKGRNAARNVLISSDCYRDGKIDGCSYQVDLRNAIVQFRNIIREIDHEYKRCGEVMGESHGKVV